jgi:hypothetical protein
MIITSSFLNHWKTRALVDRTGHKEAPLWLIALWGHCFDAHKWEFEDLPPLALKAICVASDISPEELLASLIECRWIKIKGKLLTVSGFYDANATIASQWHRNTSGVGKRPKKPANGAAAGSPPNGPPTPPRGHPVQTPTAPRTEPGVTPTTPEGRNEKEGRIEGLESEGGGKEEPDGPAPSHFDQVLLFAQSQGMQQSYVRKFYDHFTAKGWRMADGKPCASWQARLRVWAAEEGWPHPKKIEVELPPEHYTSGLEDVSKRPKPEGAP